MEAREVTAPSDSGVPGKFSGRSELNAGAGRHARYFLYVVGARRLRPLARRREMTSAPPLVRMRLRKPCLRFRRMLCGWYVRFIGDSLTRGPLLYSTNEVVKPIHTRRNRTLRCTDEANGFAISDASGLLAMPDPKSRMRY